MGVKFKRGIDIDKRGEMIVNLKKSEKLTKMGKSGALSRAKAKYNQKYKPLWVYVTEEENKEVKKYADKYQPEEGEFLSLGYVKKGSVSAFIKNAIFEKIARLKKTEEYEDIYNESTEEPDMSEEEDKVILSNIPSIRAKELGLEYDDKKILEILQGSYQKETEETRYKIFNNFTVQYGKLIVWNSSMVK